VRGDGDIRAGDVIFEVAGRPIQGTVLVAHASGRVQRFDRLVSVDGQPIRDDYDVETLCGPESTETGTPKQREFTFERDTVEFTERAASLEGLGIRVVEPDTLVELGDVPIRIWQDGLVHDVRAPAGLSVRTTAIPIFLSPASVVGATPIADLELDSGEYLAVLRRADHADLRLPIAVDRATPWTPHVRIPRSGEGPQGFAYVPSWSGSFIDPFWIMEREVTIAEYLEFVNDPQTLATIEREGFVRFPRNKASGPHAAPGDDGRYGLPDGWSPDWPVLGISWDDAVAYAQWRTDRARADGLPYTFSLPKYIPSHLAWGAVFKKKYPFGPHIRSRWISSNYARPRPSPEPVMRFPIDESVLGVYDLCGSVSEYLDEWWDQERGSRVYVGGSWGHGGHAYRELFALYGANGLSADAPSDTCGLRLVLHVDSPSPP